MSVRAPDSKQHVFLTNTYKNARQQRLTPEFCELSSVITTEVYDFWVGVVTWTSGKTPQAGYVWCFPYIRPQNCALRKTQKKGQETCKPHEVLCWVYKRSKELLREKRLFSRASCKLCRKISECSFYGSSWVPWGDFHWWSCSLLMLL